MHCPQLNRRVLLGVLGSGLASRAAAWKRVFDGKSLMGWRAEGNATWLVERGELVGRQGAGGAEGDLFTEATWTDFEFECEWRMRFPGNSGVWFRVMGPRTGYQVDFIDQPSHPGVLSGSVYCMGKAFIAENRNRASVHVDGWNMLRLRMKGDHIMVVQNGITVADVRDTAFSGPGSLGMQIHKGKAFDGMEVRLRGMRIREAV